MPSAYVGEKKALTFPILSDAYIQLTYDDYNPPNTSLENRLGMWSHTKGFTIEAIITPYDINGFGTHDGYNASVNGVMSPYSPPTVGEKWNDPASWDYGRYSQSEQHTSTSDRVGKKLMLFANTNLEFYLKNDSANNREPSSYKLGMKLIASDGNNMITETLESTKAIFTESSQYVQGTVDDIYLNNVKILEPVKYDGTKTAISSVNTSANTFMVVGYDMRNPLKIGTELFNSQNVSCGTITNITESSGNSEITIQDVSPLSSETYAYIKPPQINLYSLNSYHVSASFHRNGTMSLFVNGIKIAETLHSAATNNNFKFAFEASNIYIGQNPTVGRTTQFIGELHELAFVKTYKDKFTSLDTILPSYSNTLLYYKFEGLDE